ncbi:transposon Ty3-I Gag-Pol polyprotein [Nephila pilipes]|uniref:Transposon Ty3-I Gag-Pol polyprotein n=1 Tax=Nephila pilipes TaxID=299642 RepID=A0A8X6MLY8_NEPPI|nr:transposon Ty3-I Gag-Pol polyprotein [Nephila pilipes]
MFCLLLNQTLNSVSDLVLKPPENGKYEVLKKRLIEVHSESEASKIRTLLQGLELGDQRPSQLLTRLRSLAGDNVGEPLLKSLWLGLVANGTQTILAALNENLDQLATVADKINDLAFPQGINSVAATSDQKTAQLERQIAQLTQQVRELTSFVNRSRSPARNSNHFRIRNNSRNRFKRYQEPTDGYCFYHTNFGNKAKKCASPCSFRADISVIPKSFVPHAKVLHDLTLYSANGTKIPTYGTKRISLEFSLRRQFTWSFVIADVRQPIIGVDFLKHFNLLVDAKHQRVIDSNTKLSSNGQLPKIKHLDFISQFSTDIKHVSGSDNSVANAFSKINALNLSTTDLQHITDSQTKDEELKTLISSNDLSIKLKPLKMGNVLEIFCDVSREKVRPYVPEFQHVYVDLVGPFPPSDGFTFLLTCIDRLSRWPEVIPLSDISAEAVAKSFIANWISRFGGPAIITTDQGGQFQSHLLHSLKSMLGIQRIRTTPYHTSSNGEFFEPPSQAPTNPSEFLLRLRETFRTLKPTPASCHSSTSCFMHTALKTCSHVFVRVEGFKPSLTTPYQGPFEVLSRTDKHFTNNINDRTSTISIDRLKPAFLLNDTDSTKVPSAEKETSGCASS